MRRFRRVVAWVLGLGAAVVAAGYVAFQVSPWPSALLIRRAFDKDSAQTSRALANHVPPDVGEMLDLRYDPTDDDAYLDVYYPAAADTGTIGLPTVVWVHGGGWVSGTKNQIANYARILAGRGYTAIGVGYSIAPGKRYPTPIRQVNTALGYLAANAEHLHVDPSKFFLAGDSGGASIAAQLANIVTVPSYADALGVTPAIQKSQLAGVVLHCGPYDVGSVNLDGPFGGFMKTVLWSYSGGKDFMTNPQFATLSVINYVTSEFPPTLISVGNSDPLEPQSRAFAKTLVDRGVAVEALFYSDDYSPPLAHEYQFDLDTEAGQLALERTVAFVSARSK